MNNVPYPEYYGLIRVTGTINMQFKIILYKIPLRKFTKELFFLKYTNNFVAFIVIIILAINQDYSDEE